MCYRPRVGPELPASPAPQIHFGPCLHSPVSSHERRPEFMCTPLRNRFRLTFPFLALAMVAAVLFAAIPAFAQNPGIGAVDCNTVRANAQQTNNDPEGDVSG